MARPRAPPRAGGFLAGRPRSLAPLLLAGLVLLGAARARGAAPGDLSLHPPYFNLAESSRIAASATCGEEAPARGGPRPTEDLYCKLVGGPVAGGDPNQTIQGQYCDICTAANSNKAHPVSNAIDGTERWWQSPPLSRGLEYNEVNVTLDLGQVFHVAYVLIKFANSPRPDLWVLERSTDFGHTYQSWQYFASSKRDCLERFGPKTLDRITRDDDVICSTEYSRIVPLENGEVVVSLVNGRPGAMNFSYSPLLRDFTKATNIRLRFLRTNTLLGHLMGKALRDPTVTRRYYYSIKDISVGGRCVCHGHADVCDAKDPTDPYRLQCACQHNTCGGSCDQCCPGFHQRLWQPATMDSTNECQPCNCHGHAFDCYYDPEVDRRNASQNKDHIYQGGGVCIDCQHHTTGINCERCEPGFYRSPDHPLDSPHACHRCECESDFTDGTCEDLTGHCYCRPSFTGKHCDACAEGFTGFPHCHPKTSFYPNGTGAQVLPAGQIINCDCSASGTLGNACRKDPLLGRCVCKPNFQGNHCELCAPGFYGQACQPCQCSSPGVLEGHCDRDSGQCPCRSGFMGTECDRCAPGYFHYPLCQLCGCSPEGTLPEGCDEAGHCPCRPEFDGPHCDHCRAGYHSYPDCQACACDPRGALDQLCGAGGACHCRPGYAGPTCQACSPGFHGFPACVPCHCSADGSLHSACDPRSGQCRCRPHVTGLRCDMCVSGTYDFPHCKAGSCHPAGLAPVDPTLPEIHKSCVCRAHVEGTSCDRCKSGYWGLSPSNPEGCTRCSCDPRGTLGGIAECQQGSGQCFCRPHVCGQTCAGCREGFYGLDQAHYFGCRGCQCDVGGALGQACEPRTGACLCRPNTQGSTCSQPAPNHYLPDLHHLRLELEEAATPDGHTVRFGFNPLEFENFSWRGYAQMSPIQPRIVARLNVTSPDLFRLVFRYVNRGPTRVTGHVSVREEGLFDTCANCTEQSQSVIFPPSTEPAFIMVPQRGFGEPFVMNPGSWVLLVEAEGVLLDYVALLPSTYYEAALLQLRVTEACTYHPTAQPSLDNCLLYAYLSLDGFPSATGQDALCRQDNSLPRPCLLEQLSPSHPLLAACLGNDVDVQLQMSVPHRGPYVLVVQYANEDSRQEVGVAVHSPQRAPQQGTITLYPCSYSTLCRGTAVNTQHHLAIFHLDTEANIRLTAEHARFFLHGVTLVPAEEFSMEFVTPRVHCISRHGTFGPKSVTCLSSRFPKPPQPIILRDCQVLLLSPDLPLTHSQELTPGSPPAGPQPRPPTAVDPEAEPTLLRHPQGTVVYTTHVPALGRYAFLLHGYQPAHPTFPVEVLINGGRIWHGQANASFCPHGYGCRTLVVCEGQTVLDVTDSELTVTLRVPEGRWFWLDYVLVVPEDVYTVHYLQEDPLDKSYDFINHCAAQGYHVSPSSSPFCRNAAISLSLFYNNGALPCGCHEVGATGPMCEPFGGQCPCRAHVIGRDCSRCTTGYWGFPHCRPCECGVRLCDELTGKCICPPRTLQPDCVVCQPQTFGCHPLVGCEECNCSGPGVQELTEPSCDVDSGQCRCRPNVAGRRCDTCAPGFHGYPSCLPCDCDEAGTAPGVCSPFTGQCYCKENVQGLRCDQCRLGTFSLDAANPKGCTSCFCFGATERCGSSPHGRREFVDMEGWTLLSGDRQVVPHEWRAEIEMLRADLRDGPETPLDMYWQAPPSYLGDRVSSYGGMLRYELHSETQRGDVFIPTASRPDVVLQGNQMSIAFREPAYPPPGHRHHGQLQLVEENLWHLETHNPVSREELMMVLAGLEQLQIRALFSQISSAVSLHRVVLEIADVGGRGPPASNVELCMCPANYRGDSCQECAPGYYRDTKGLFLGRCIPCQCHGHSDSCLPGSGICVGCQHNTEGEHCERCQPGFVSSGPEGPEAPCTSCPCPLAAPSNNFAVGCVLRGGRAHCLCRPGYAGASCERCAPGFFGNPVVLGSSCQPCDCSGNGDPNMLFNDCDPLTGACRGCMRHTTGPRCETCAPGFYGNALLPGNCSRCDCSPCGTEGCDPHTGRCLCKAGVTGRRCDRCQQGHYGFEGCGGCRPCSCGPAAEGSECHPQSGQCHCQRGAGGPQCRECAPGHWGVPEHGCQRCQCRGGHCDPRTGRCSCPPGLSGERCDQCSQQHQVPVPSGPGGHGVHCEVCDHCVVLLLDDLERAGALLPAIREQLRGVNASSAAWAHLHRLNASITALQDQLRSPHTSQQETSRQLEILELQSGTLLQDMQHLHDQTELIQEQASQLNANAKDTQDRARMLLTAVQAVAANLSDLGAQTDLFPANASAPSGEQLHRTLAEVQKLLAEMRARDFGALQGVAESELDKAQRLLTQVRKQLTDRWEENQALAQLTRDQLAQHEAGLMDLREALNRAVATTLEAEGLNSRNQERLEEALQRKQELSRENTTLQATLQAARDILALASGLLRGIDEDKEEYERLAASLDGAQTPLFEKIRAFSPASSKVELVEAAEAHAQQLDQVAQNLSSIIRRVNQDHIIQRAIDASNAYSSILQKVRTAEDEAAKALLEASQVWAMVVQQGLQAQARDLLANTSVLEKRGLDQRRRLDGVLGALQAAGTQLRDAQARKDQLAAQIQDAKAMLAMDTGTTSEKIAHAKAVVTEAQDMVNRVQSRLPDMQGNLGRWWRQYEGLQGQDLNKTVQDAGHSVSTLEKTLPQLLAKLSLLEGRGGHNASLALSASIARVRQLIAQARGAASKVKVPMKFNGRSGVQVRAPRDLADLAAYTALKFYLQAPEPAPGQAAGDYFVLYMGSRQASGDYMGVALRDQKVHWVYRLGEAGPATLSIDEDIGEEFATVSIDRTLQFGHMSITMEKQMVHETKGDTKAPGAEGLLNLLPEDFVFYVGGYPSNFTPPAPLRLPGYHGCIEVATLNEEVLSLYNFEKTFQLNTAVDKPCPRSKSTGDPWLTDGSYLDGTGFARITFESQMSNTKRFDQELRLVSYNGVVFFLPHQGQFLCLAIRERRLVLLYDFGEGLKEAAPMLPDLTELTSASKAVQVFLLGGTRKRVLVRVERVTVFSVEQENTLEHADAYFLGGAPPHLLPPSLQHLFPSGGSVRGCVKGIKALGKYVDLKRLNTSGISAGCTADLLVERTMSFSGHSFLKLKLLDVGPLAGNIYSGFGFRSTQLNGLLFYWTTSDGLCQVFLQEGRLTLQLLQTELKTRGHFADGGPHYVAFYSNTTGVWLYVDDQLQQMKVHRRPSSGTQLQPEGCPCLFLGGLPEPSAVVLHPGVPSLRGCISNAFVQHLQGPQRVFDLQQNVGSSNVTTGCTLPAQDQSPEMGPQGLQAPVQKASRRGRHSAQDPACSFSPLPRSLRDAYQFGGPLSTYLEFAVLHRVRSHTSMLVRPVDPHGLLLLSTPLKSSSPSLVLFMSHGHLVAKTEGPGHHLQVQSQGKLQAGRWHTVAVRWMQGWVQLTTDGIRVQSQKGPLHRHQRWQGPQSGTLFVGGLPPGNHHSQLLVAHHDSGFSGCVKRLKWNGQLLGAPRRMRGVTPCSTGPLEAGLFFAGRGGIMTVDLPAAPWPRLDLELELRPQAAMGLVFHLGRVHTPPYLQLWLLEKQALLQGDDGVGKFSTLVSFPKTLCDGEWHRLSVTKAGVLTRLEVDASSNETQSSTWPTVHSLMTLHLGGVPEPLDTSRQPPAYRGCMRDLQVNGAPVPITSSVSIQGTVGASGCPVT
ncbi:laminin subunit alpha-5 [Rhynchocyon petersi]